MIRRRIRIAAPYGSSVIFFGSSVIRVPLTALGKRPPDVSGLLRNVRLLARYSGVFQAKSELEPRGTLRAILGRYRAFEVAMPLAEQFLFPCQRMPGDG